MEPLWKLAFIQYYRGKFFFSRKKGNRKGYLGLTIIHAAPEFAYCMSCATTTSGEHSNFTSKYIFIKIHLFKNWYLFYYFIVYISHNMCVIFSACKLPYPSSHIACNLTETVDFRYSYHDFFIHLQSHLFFSGCTWLFLQEFLEIHCYLLVQLAKSVGMGSVGHTHEKFKCLHSSSKLYQ